MLHHSGTLSTESRPGVNHSEKKEEPLTVSHLWQKNLGEEGQHPGECQHQLHKSARLCLCS